MKNRTMNTTQTSSIRRGRKAPGAVGPRRARARTGFAPARRATARMPAASSTKKIHQAASRWCSLSRKRSKCSWMKKKCGCSGLLQADQHEPRRGDREEQQQALDQVQAGPELPVAREQRCRAPAPRPAAPGRSGPWTAPTAPCRPSRPASSCAVRARRGAVALGEQQGAQGDGHHAGQAHVERIDLAAGDPVEAGAEHQAGVEADALRRTRGGRCSRSAARRTMPHRPVHRRACQSPRPNSGEG